ncbi:beta-1,6-N-acetylglucosaminyltransferase [Aerococcus urinaeequi]|uniref:beta-1,6-N-acetylglucosaminyltransferase n=1 Tax=Aerococcus urinaeequi TaxID=51665 RepID=UPI003D6B3E0A
MHAYLIEAHKSDFTLETLLTLLDDERNDIFIHMDKKNINFSPEYYKHLVQRSNLFFTERISVNWGGYSQIEAELILIEAAITASNKYEYIHLLSGQDLPIKTQDYIHNFFRKNNGKEFVRFQDEKFQFNDRVRYYHSFQEILPRNSRILNKINSMYISTQKFIGIKRNKNINFQKGSNWFSITYELGSFIIENKNWIYNTFKHTYCADELFLQTIVYNTEFKNKLFEKKFNNSLHSIMRVIDWERGKPYTFGMEDLVELINSDMLFARKFDEEKDKNIIQAISASIKKQNNKKTLNVN